MAVAGCGGHGAPRQRSVATHTTIAPLGVESTHSPLLVYFKRFIGLDPLASELTIHRDGSAVALITFGGPGGQRRRGFALSRAQSGRLGSLVRSARRAGLHSTGCCDVNRYIYTVSLAGRSVRWEQRNVPAADRSLVALLNRLLDRYAGD